MKQRTPEEAAKFRTAIFAGITAGKEVKDIAVELDAPESHIYTLLRRGGYEKMILSPEERFVMTQYRKNPKAFTKAVKRGGK